MALPRSLVRLAAAAARTRTASAARDRRRQRPMSEDEFKTTVIKLLRERRGGRRYGGTASQGPNSSNTSESLKTAGVGMVMFGAVWQYIDKSNELVKEQDASSPWWKQFWFRRD
ncbi:unnamed protein product [Urochloa humidicola]